LVHPDTYVQLCYSILLTLMLIFFFLLVFLVLGFELRASCLLGGHFTALPYILGLRGVTLLFSKFIYIYINIYIYIYIYIFQYWSLNSGPCTC
jgi:hypothetical protein